MKVQNIRDYMHLNWYDVLCHLYETGRAGWRRVVAVALERDVVRQVDSFSGASKRDRHSL